MADFKTFPIVLTIEKHKLIKDAAAKEHLSMNRFIVKTMLEKVEKEGE